MKNCILFLSSQSVRLLGENQQLHLPMELNNGTVFVYQDENMVTVERADKQFKVECNLKYDLCSVELSGWYYGKTAGLLGTMDNEPSDDNLGSDGRFQRNIGHFAKSWALEREVECMSNDNAAWLAPPGDDNGQDSDFCRELFTNKSSVFSSCFGVVEPHGYRIMCANSADNRDACAVAMAYLQTCMFHDTYLRIPDVCTPCAAHEANGAEVPEGDFRKLEGKCIVRAWRKIFY